MTVAVVAAAPSAAPHSEVAVVMAMPMTVLVLMVMPVLTVLLVPRCVGRAVEKPSGKHLWLLMMVGT